MTYTTIEEYRAAYPDLPSMGRKDLLKAFNEMLRIFNEIDTRANTIEKVKANISNVTQEVNKIRYGFSKHEKTVIAVMYAVIAIMLWIELEFFIGALVLSGMVMVVFSFCVKVKNSISPAKSQAALAEMYRVQKLVPLEQQLQALKNELNVYLCSGEVQWLKEALNNKYLNKNIIKMLIEFVDSGRADSLKEALNLYEEVAHRERMETMQSSILAASQLSAENTAITAQATALTAYSAARSANANEQAASDINRIRRSIR